MERGRWEGQKNSAIKGSSAPEEEEEDTWTDYFEFPISNFI
jgi:hypothetical protein